MCPHSCTGTHALHTHTHTVFISSSHSQILTRYLRKGPSSQFNSEQKNSSSHGCSVSAQLQPTCLRRRKTIKHGNDIRHRGQNDQLESRRSPEPCRASCESPRTFTASPTPPQAPSGTEFRGRPEQHNIFKSLALQPCSLLFTHTAA